MRKKEAEFAPAANGASGLLCVAVLSNLRARNGKGRTMFRRAVGKLATLANEADATAALPGISERPRNITYVYRQRRGESFPAHEEFYTAAPGPSSRPRPGMVWFEAILSGDVAAQPPATRTA